MPFLQMRIFPAQNLSCGRNHHFQLLICGPQNWNKTWNKYTNIHLLRPFCWGLCMKTQSTTFSSAKPARKHMQASHLETEWETKNQIRKRFIQRMWEIYLWSWRGPHDGLVAKIQTGFSIWRVLQEFSYCDPAPCNQQQNFIRGPRYWGCQGQLLQIWLFIHRDETPPKTKDTGQIFYLIPTPKSLNNIPNPHI